MKRPFDVVIAMLALVACAPLLALLAVLVRWQLGSPVIFSQVRSGKHGRSFRCYKFRTMTNACNADGRDSPDAERLTPFGRRLRSTSLDELPELWNVLRGDMSLVGPRPLLVDYLNHYTAAQARRHNVRPGITGLAQVNGRNATSWPRRLEWDSWYADNVSLRLDVRILWQTVAAVVSRRGVHADGYATMPRFDEVNAHAQEAHHAPA